MDSDMRSECNICDTYYYGNECKIKCEEGGDSCQNGI